MLMKYLILILLSTTSVALIAQTRLTITDGTSLVVSDEVELVLQDAALITDGSLQANAGTVGFIGEADTSQAFVGGAAATTFYRLTIDKSAGGLALLNDVAIDEQLTLTEGLTYLNDYDLSLDGTLTATDPAQHYVVVNGAGGLGRMVGANTLFPIGTPEGMANAYLTDTDASAFYYLRVTDSVYTQGDAGAALTDSVINHTWQVERMSGGSTFGLTLQWEAPTAELTDFDASIAYVSHFDGGSWSTGAHQDVGSATYPAVTRYGNTQDGLFAVGSGGTALPVELLAFEARPEASHNALTWQVGVESGLAFYQIEYSPDAISWQPIGEVTAAGHSNYDYRHDDYTPVSYYRLRLVDLDGSEELSEVRVVMRSSGILTEANILPNPTYGPLTLTYELPGARDLTLTIFDALGRRVIVESLDGAAGENMQKLSLEGLAQGVYHVTLMGEGVQESWRVVKR